MQCVVCTENWCLSSGNICVYKSLKYPPLPCIVNTDVNLNRYYCIIFKCTKYTHFKSPQAILPNPHTSWCNIMFVVGFVNQRSLTKKKKTDYAETNEFINAVSRTKKNYIQI